MSVQQTLVLIKPDAVKRALIGEMIRRFENAGLKIAGMKMVWVDRKLAQQHYSEHVEKPFYAGLEKFITEGPVVAMVLEGIEAISIVRKIVGPTEPSGAAPGTIRGDFAHHGKSHTDKKGTAIRNLIHASGNADEASKEIGIWFSADELHEYSVMHENHTF
jgi:nucleoside-diphosphate kinase